MPSPDERREEGEDEIVITTAFDSVSLEDDGLIAREGEGYRTTRRFQAAMARAAVRLAKSGETSSDLRVPIAAALIEIYGDELTDDTLAELTEFLLPIEEAELTPRLLGTAPEML